MSHGIDSHPPGSASQFSTLQNLIKPFVGAGILALPSAFKEGGVLASAILMAILAVGVNYCIRCLLHCVDYVYAREYGLDYDVTTGKFSLAADHADDNGSLDRNIINSADDATQPLTGTTTSRSSPSGHVDDSFVLDESVTAVSPSVKLNRFSSPVLHSNRLLPSTIMNTSYDSDASMASITVPPPVHARLTRSLSSANALLTPPVYSFREIGDFAYGKYGVLMVDINLVASQLGFCIAYMSFISQNMLKIFSTLNRIEWILILIVIWSILSQIRDVKKLAWSSAIGNIIYLVSIGIIFYDGFAHSCCVSVDDTDWVRVQGLALVFGTGCFALEGIGLVLPVKRAMKEQEKFGRVLNIAIAFVACCYIIFGVLGYLFYGEGVHSVITDNMRGGALSDAVRISLSLSLIFTYVIQLFPVSEICDSVWDRNVFFKENTHTGLGGAGGQEKYQALSDPSNNADSIAAESDSSQMTKNSSYQDRAGSTSPIADPIPIRPTLWKREITFILTRIGLVIFTGLISIIFPNFGLIISLVGSFSNSAIAFILPQIFYMKLVLKYTDRCEMSRKRATSDSWIKRNQEFILSWTIICLGVFASIVGVWTTIAAIVNGGDD